MKIDSLVLTSVVLAAIGCGSSVGGGGGTGAGGAGGAGATATATSSTATSMTTTTSTGAVGGSGGTGSGLGDCEMQSGSASAASGSTITCETEYLCSVAGPVTVACSSDDVTTTCTCSMNGAVQGTCEGAFSCTFPQSCCFELLGGHARPNPGPYGMCSSASATATSAGSGGEAMCSSFYDCDGGSISIDCEGVAGNDATCTCKDGQGFLLGSCQQSDISCDYESNCCYAILN
jgi:hypothetical protein